MAQPGDTSLKEIEQLVQQEGELFLAIDRVSPQDNKVCLEENSILNTVKFSADSAFVNYINYTELFCEVYVMRTQYTYHFDIKTIDPATIRLVEKKYSIGAGKLKEGNPGWFEVQLFSRDNGKTIIRRELDSKQSEGVSTVSLIVKEKDTAKKVIALFKASLLSKQNQ
jgi:hypothetical protein